MADRGARALLAGGHSRDTKPADSGPYIVQSRVAAAVIPEEVQVWVIALSDAGHLELVGGERDCVGIQGLQPIVPGVIIVLLVDDCEGVGGGSGQLPDIPQVGLVGILVPDHLLLGYCRDGVRVGCQLCHRALECQHIEARVAEQDCA